MPKAARSSKKADEIKNEDEAPTKTISKGEAITKQRARGLAKAAKLSGPLKGLTLTLCGTLEMTQNALEQLIESNGALCSRVYNCPCYGKATHMITNEDGLKSTSKKMAEAKKAGLPLVSLQWLHDSIAAGVPKPVDAYLLTA
eukprot:TRINITY_DN24169_c0_g1_i1.p1 TRINITY_DN24169_c0_g1~~TRINITY_DN24169_c0_g1_i1.p1  ORF type:complete len:143 (+),score=8.67 TRINITY_DN24169_c0_g1_i1:74-502(+)